MGMRMLPVVAAAMIVFAGCSDDDDGSDSGSDTTEAVAAATSETDAGSDAESQGESSGSGEGAGTWQLTQQTFDNNANYELDDDELATATGPEYGIFALEIADDGTCTFSNDSEEGFGTCQVGSCEDLVFTDFDCELLEATNQRMLAIENAPASATTLGGRYGLLALTDDQIVLKDITGPMGTIYVYTRV